MAGKCRWPISMSKPSETGLKIKFTITLQHQCTTWDTSKNKNGGNIPLAFRFLAFGSVSQLV